MDTLEETKDREDLELALQRLDDASARRWSLEEAEREFGLIPADGETQVSPLPGRVGSGGPGEGAGGVRAAKLLP